MFANSGLWRTEFDPILNQVYYVNCEDGSVSFDLPCEVQNAPKRNSNSGFFSRISSKLSLHRSRNPKNLSCPVYGEVVKTHSAPSSEVSDSSSESGSESYISDQSEAVSDSQSLTQNTKSYAFSPDPTSYPNDDVVPRNAYLADQAFRLEEHEDAASIVSEESIQSFYHELPRSEIYFDHENAVYVDKHLCRDVDFDKEQERYEFRQQMMRELYWAFFIDSYAYFDYPITGWWFISPYTFLGLDS